MYTVVVRAVVLAHVNVVAIGTSSQLRAWLRVYAYWQRLCTWIVALLRLLSHLAACVAACVADCATLRCDVAVLSLARLSLGR